ncbi:MAG: polysaccharide lyase family 7 protein, partial [Flavobacteriales bacterium]
MDAILVKSFLRSLLSLTLIVVLNSCLDTAKKSNDQDSEATIYPSDVIPFMDEWKILLGDGTHRDTLINYAKKDFFYVANDGKQDWVVYKTPNSGITSRTSSNTRTELGQKEQWTPEIGGKLTGTLKVMHVSTS